MAVTYRVSQGPTVAGPWTTVPGSPFAGTNDIVPGLVSDTDYYFQIIAQDVLLGISSTPIVIGPIRTTSTRTESLEGTSVTTTTGTIYASQTPGTAAPVGGPFTTMQLSAGGQVIRNGVVDPSKNGITQVYYHNHTTYIEAPTQTNSFGGPPAWWADTGVVNNWVDAANPLPAGETLAISNIANGQINQAFPVQGTIGGLTTIPTLQFRDLTGTTTPTVFDDEFNSLPLHRTWQAGDLWSPVATYSPDGLSESSSLWTNPFNPLTPINGLYDIVTASDGDLALRVALLNTPAANQSGVNQVAGKTCNFVSTMVNNQNTALRLHGYWEFRVAVQKVPGFTFFFDIEDYPANPTWTSEINIGIYTNAGGVQTVALQTAGTGGSTTNTTATPVGFDATQFHIYAVDWQANNITFYIDNVQVWQVATPTDGSYGFPMFAYLFSAANYDINGVANLGDPSPASLPAYAYVSYFHVYATKPTSSQVAGPWTALPGGSTVQPNLFSFNHPPLTTAQPHIQVSVRDANNPSIVATSNDFSIANVTLGTPGVVTGLQATSVGSTRLNLTFMPPTTGGALDNGIFQVSYKQASANTYTNGPAVPYATQLHGSFSDGTSTLAVDGNGHITINGSIPPGDVTIGVTFLTILGGTVWQFVPDAGKGWYSTPAPVSGSSSYSGPSSTSPFVSLGVPVTGLAQTTAYNFEVSVSNSSGTGLPCLPISASTSNVTAQDFTISNGQIVDPNGNVFHIQGTAQYANNEWTQGQWQDTLYATYTDAQGVTRKGYEAFLTAFPRMTYLRIVIWRDYVGQFGSYGTGFFDEAINYLTARGVVCAFDTHDYYDVLSDGWLNTMAGEYASLAAHYKDNPRVWFESQNEPHTDSNDFNLAAAQFATQATTLYNAVRNAGNNQPFVITVNWGTPYAFQWMDHASDFIGLNKIILAIHYYPEAPDNGGQFESYIPAGYYFPDETYNSQYNMLSNCFNGIRSWWAAATSAPPPPIIIGETGGSCCGPGDSGSWPQAIQAEVDQYHQGNYNGFVCWLFGPPWYGTDEMNVPNQPYTLSASGAAFRNGML